MVCWPQPNVEGGVALDYGGYHVVLLGQQAENVTGDWFVVAFTIQWLRRGLLRCPGHVLRRQSKGRGTDLPAVFILAAVGD
jgi:hypothetical protein